MLHRRAADLHRHGDVRIRDLICFWRVRGPSSSGTLGRGSFTDSVRTPLACTLSPCLALNVFQFLRGAPSPNRLGSAHRRTVISQASDSVEYVKRAAVRGKRSELRRCSESGGGANKGSGAIMRVEGGKTETQQQWCHSSGPRAGKRRCRKLKAPFNEQVGEPK